MCVPAYVTIRKVEVWTAAVAVAVGEEEQRDAAGDTDGLVEHHLRERRGRRRDRRRQHGHERPRRERLGGRRGRPDWPSPEPST